MKVFTDGSVSGNGKKASKGGFAVYFGPNHPHNYRENKINITNNQAELLAIIKALEIIREFYPSEKIELYSDSQLSIKVITGEWKGKKNLDLLKRIEYLLNLPTELDVTFIHVRAHTGLKDEISLGNQMADRMAQFV